MAEARVIVELTQRVRDAPLEEIRVSVPVASPRRRLAGVAQSAVAVAIVAVIGVWLGVSASGPNRPRTPATLVPQGAVGAASNPRADWPAGLPRSPQVVQLVPGGLYTSGVGYNAT